MSGRWIIYVCECGNSFDATPFDCQCGPGHEVEVCPVSELESAQAWAANVDQKRIAAERQLEIARGSAEADDHAAHEIGYDRYVEAGDELAHDRAVPEDQEESNDAEEEA